MEGLMKDRNPHNLTERCELCRAWKYSPPVTKREQASKRRWGECMANPPVPIFERKYAHTDHDDFCLSMFTPIGKCKGLCKKHGMIECSYNWGFKDETEFKNYIASPEITFSGYGDNDFRKRALDDLNACEQFEPIEEEPEKGFHHMGSKRAKKLDDDQPPPPPDMYAEFWEWEGGQ
jgi:hypothetical protein